MRTGCFLQAACSLFTTTLYLSHSVLPCFCSSLVWPHFCFGPRTNQNTTKSWLTKFYWARSRFLGSLKPKRTDVLLWESFVFVFSSEFTLSHLPVFSSYKAPCFPFHHVLVFSPNPSTSLVLFTFPDIFVFTDEIGTNTDRACRPLRWPAPGPIQPQLHRQIRIMLHRLMSHIIRKLTRWYLWWILCPPLRNNSMNGQY